MDRYRVQHYFKNRENERVICSSMAQVKKELHRFYPAEKTELEYSVVFRISDGKCLGQRMHFKKKIRWFNSDTCG